MDKNRGEPNSKTLFRARDCNTSTAAAAFAILFYCIFFNNPVKIPKLSKLAEEAFVVK